MPRPKTKNELLAASWEKFDKLLALTRNFESGDLDEVEIFESNTVKDILAHLHEWHNMYLIWYREGMSGEKPPLPAPGFTWKDTPALNEQIRKQFQDESFAKVFADLQNSHQAVMDIIQSHSDEELFTKKRYAWTGSTSLGSYTVSSTSSRYDWAIKEIRRFLKNQQ